MIKKRTILLLPVFLFLFAHEARSYVWEGFERANLWLLTAIENNAVDSLNIVSTNFSEGVKALMIDLEKTSWSKKGFVSREGLYDLSEIQDMELDVFAERSVGFSIGLSTGPKNIWFESPNFNLTPGWNKGIKVDLTRDQWKSEASFWENVVKPQDLQDTKKIVFVFNNGEPGKVYLDNIRFQGKQIDNDAMTMPMEIPEKEKAISQDVLLKSIKPVTYARAFSKGIVKDKANLVHLQYMNISQNNKAVFEMNVNADWKDVSFLTFRMKNNNPKDPLAFALSVQSGNGWIWYETPKTLLKPVESSEITFNLNAPYFKSEASGWNYNSFLFFKNNIRALDLLIYGLAAKPVTGDITMEDFKLIKGETYLAKRKILPSVYEAEKGSKKKYEKPDIREILKFPPRIEKFDKFEISFLLNQSYLNPYNPDEVFCEGIFISPEEKEFRIPAFYYDDIPDPKDNKKSVQLWRIRFAPVKEGKWRFKIRTRNPRGELVYDKAVLAFDCTSSQDKGFVLARDNLFTFADNSVFYPVGQSLCWVTVDDKNTFYSYMDKMNQVGENCTRIWNCPWGLTPEWMPPKGKGLGRYSKKDSLEFDKVIDYARDKNIFLEMCINFHGAFIEGSNWEQNPYNFANGGPAKSPKDFFTDEIAKKYFKRKLLYMVARWGYSTSIMAWELFNEVDITTGYNEDEVASWHKEMSDYINSIDPYCHLISTSFSRRMGGDKVFSLPGINFSQTHIYTEDFQTALFSIPMIKVNKYKKPHFTAEAGGSTEESSTEAEDKIGFRLHNALWYGLFSLAPSSALYWWWDSYIDSNNLYSQYNIFNTLIKSLDLGRLKKVDVKINSTFCGDFFYAPPLDWEESTGFTYRLTNNELAGDGLLSKFLQGGYQKQWIVYPEFNMPFLKNGKFMFYLETASSAGAGFSIFIDDKLVSKKDFPVITEGSPPEVATVYEANVPQGMHKIKLVSNGPDWFKVRWFKFTNCVPDVEAHGLRDGKYVFIWIRNRGFDMDKVLKKAALKPSGAGGIEMENPWPERSLKAVSYDTWTGQKMKDLPVELLGNTIRVNYPSMDRDLLIILEHS